MSMLAFAMLARAATLPPPPPAPPPPPPPPKITPVPSPDRPLGPDVGVGTDEMDEEIVILARKLRLVHVHLQRSPTGAPLKCTVLRSSGDTEVDTLTCDSAKACATRYPDRKTPPEVMIECTREEQARRVEELAEKRIEEEMAK